VVDHATGGTVTCRNGVASTEWTRFEGSYEFVSGPLRPMPERPRGRCGGGASPAPTRTQRASRRMRPASP
jgi:hypothetical protein